ncbi:MAG: LysM peptidoglycan-binding domain-containing protein [Phycisphaeraceae bacterium]
MTTLHKLTLAGIAAVCVLVIAVNFNTSGSTTSETPPAAMVETQTVPANPTARTATDETATPLLLGPRLTESRGLEDLVSEIRQVAHQDSNEAAASSNPVTPTIDESSVTSRAPRSTDEASASTSPINPLLAQGELTEPLPAPTPAIIEPSTLTLGPAPATGASSDARPKITEEDLSTFADIPVEVELPPAQEQVEGKTVTSEPGEDIASREAPAVGKALSSEFDSGSTFKPFSLTAEPPGTTAPPALPQPPVIAKANEPAEAIAPPPAKANVPAIAEKVAPKEPPVKAAEAASKSPAAGSEKTYAIQPGDTFSSIAIIAYGAERHWMEIADANPDVDPKRLKVGQVIKLPGVGDDSAAPVTSAKINTNTTHTPRPAGDTSAPAAKAAPPASAEKSHEVKAGENLWTISRKYYDTADHWRHIYITNRQAIGGDPGKLQLGMKLKITTPTD